MINLEKIMEMNSAVINGVFLIIGVLLSSAISYFMAAKDRKYKEALSDIKMLAKQCETFWCLEQSYLNYIYEVNPKDKPKSIQTKRRLLLSLDPKLDKITINPSNVNRLLKKWNL